MKHPIRINVNVRFKAMQISKIKRFYNSITLRPLIFKEAYVQVPPSNFKKAQIHLQVSKRVSL